MKSRIKLEKLLKFFLVTSRKNIFALISPLLVMMETLTMLHKMQAG